MSDASGGGGCRWQDQVEPELRPRVVDHLVVTMAGLCRALNKSDNSPPDSLDLHQRVASFEEHVFKAAKDKVDYMRRISARISMCKEKVNAQAAADRQQQMHQMQLPNMVQAIQGVNNFPFTTTPPQSVPMTGSPSWTPVQPPNQHMTCSSASNMQSNASHGTSDTMAMLYHQNFNSESSTVAPVAPTIQSSQQIMQPTAMQTENQFPAMQPQPTNIAQCHPANMVQLQGQQIARPNGHKNHLLGQNVLYLQQTAQQQEDIGITQQQVGMHMQYQMHRANVAMMNTGYSCGWNNQQNAGWASGMQSPSKACGLVALKGQANMDAHPIAQAQSQVTVNQQSNLQCPSPQNPARIEESSGEVDWREEMLQQIKVLKDAYFSELVELYQNFDFKNLTEEQFKSLPREEANKYKNDLHIKNSISCALKFLQLEKSLETYRGKLLKYQKLIHILLRRLKTRKTCNEEMNTGLKSNILPSQDPRQTISLTGGTSNQQKLPLDESIGQMRQNIVTTPSAGPETHSNQLQGVASPYFSQKSPGPLQSSLTNDVELCCKQSPITECGVASPNVFLESTTQSPTTKKGVVPAASPCVSVKSAVALVKKTGFEAAASPSALVKSASPLVIAKSGIVPVALTYDRYSSFFLQNNAAVNGCNQATTTKLLTPTPTSGQVEDQEHVKAETQMAMKPIDRLIAAMRSSSPAVLRSTLSLMKSALIDMDSVPLRIGSNNKMKRVFDATPLYVSPTFCSTNDSTETFEYNASDSECSRYCSGKKQKTQDAKDALLLDEVEAVNSRHPCHGWIKV